MQAGLAVRRPRLSELPEPGSYKLCDIVGAPILLARGDDGDVRAFYNACRHRGAPVVRGALRRRPACSCASSTRGATTCAGNLARVPDERDFVGLQTRASAACRRCAARRGAAGTSSTSTPTPMPLLEWLDPLPTAAARARRRTVPRDRRQEQVELGCNWKILAEAFLEVYHARTIHPKTVGPSLDTRGTVITLYDHGHQSMLSPGATAGPAADNRELLPVFEGATEMFLDDVQPGARDLPQPDHAARCPRLPVPRVLAAGHRPHPARHHLVRGRLGRRRACRPTSGRSGSTG